jgi:hypothetical protein
LSEGPRPGLSPAVRLVFALALALYLGVAAWLLWRTSILEAYSDMYDWIARWDRLQADGELGRYLWAPHNFHHLVWTFAVLGADIRAFGASGYLFLAVGALCLAATAAMLASLGAAVAGPGLRLVGAGGAAALCLTGCNVLDASVDINTTYVHALVFAVAAILLAEAPGARSLRRRGGALACAVAAGLGSAAGLAVWPALLFAAWRAGERRWMWAVLAAGVAFCGLYLLGETAGPAGAAGSASGVRLGEAIALAVNYLALPWLRGAPSAGWVIGLVVLALSAAALAAKGRRDAPWPERAAVALILFSLTTAAMAGIARTGATSPQLTPMRYAVFLAPLHVGLWALALPYLRQAWARRPGRWEAAVVAAAAVMLLHQAVMAVYAVRTSDQNLRLVADFRSGQRTQEMMATIYPDLGKAQTLATAMRREGLYQRELRPDPPPSGSGISVSSTGR